MGRVEFSDYPMKVKTLPLSSSPIFSYLSKNMTLQQKKEHVLRCVSLGMETERAYLIAECTIDEKNLLDEDDAFQERICLAYALEEKRLLEELSAGSKVAVANGNTQAVRWMLEKINAPRYQTNRQKSVDNTPKKLPEINIRIVGKTAEKNNDVNEEADS